MAISLNFAPTSYHLRPLQVENCDSNSRIVVDDDDNSKFRLERVKSSWLITGNKEVHDLSLTLSARGPTLYIRI